jgi:uncharacterized membrane protein YcaP (DUF421 family)
MVAAGNTRCTAFEDVVNGREVTPVRDGHWDRHPMCQASVPRRNLEEAIRQKVGDAQPSSVHLAIPERDGKITLIGSFA